jgi:hypothetical protein
VSHLASVGLSFGLPVTTVIHSRTVVIDNTYIISHRLAVNTAIHSSDKQNKIIVKHYAFSCGTHGWRGEVFTGFWLGGSKARDHWKDLGVGRRITLKWILGRYGSLGRTGFGWLRIGSSGGIL